MQNRPRAWLFGISHVPFGAFNGLVLTSLPYLLRKEGVPVDRIATMIAVATFPMAWGMFFAPVVDLRWNRKTWIIAGSGASAMFVFATLLLPAAHLEWITVMAFLGCVCAVIASTATGALAAASMPAELQGSAGGWMTVGNLGGTGVGGAITLWLVERLSMPEVAAITAAIVFLPSVAVIAIPAHERMQEAFGRRIKVLLSEIGRALRSRRTIMVAILCCSPLGAGAAISLFSAIAPDYRVMTSVVIWLSGFGGGLLTSLGALIGGAICDRIPRIRAYVLFGCLLAADALIMAIAPVSQVAFVVGSSAYLLTTGLCYAGFYAMLFETIGGHTDAAATEYSLLNGLGNLPVTYMTFFNGRGYARWGTRGLLMTDGVAGACGTLLAILLLALFGNRRQMAIAEVAPLTSPDATT